MDIENLFNHMDVISPEAVSEICKEYTEVFELLADAITKDFSIFVHSCNEDNLILQGDDSGREGEFNYNKKLLINRCISLKSSAVKKWYYDMWPHDNPKDCLTPEKKDDNFYRYLRNVDEVPADRAKDWYRKDKLRFGALVSAISNGRVHFRELHYEMREVPEKNTIYIAEEVESRVKGQGTLTMPNGVKCLTDRVDAQTYYIPSEKEGYGRELEIAHRLKCFQCDFRIDSKTLSCWIETNYSNDPVQKEVTFPMSSFLSIAIQCNKDLQESGGFKEDSSQSRNKRINEWFDTNHPGITGNKREHIRLVITG